MFCKCKVNKTEEKKHDVFKKSQIKLLNFHIQSFEIVPNERKDNFYLIYSYIVNEQIAWKLFFEM